MEGSGAEGKEVVGILVTSRLGQGKGLAGLSDELTLDWTCHFLLNLTLLNTCKLPEVGI